MKWILLTLLGYMFVSHALFAQETAAQDIRTLIVFFDGLRPDYITPEAMPHVYAFSKTASFGKNHHSVFPTVTRVNATSYSTGSYPKTHGIMGNTVYFPEVKDKKILDTGDFGDLRKIDEATNGHLTTAVTLGETLHRSGTKMMVFSSGSTGQAMMQNHTVSGGAIVNPSLILPESFKDSVVNAIGPIPPKGTPNTAQHKWITDALIHYGLRMDGPLVSAIWFSDPDGTAHDDGIGVASSMESIRIVDAEFGRIVRALKDKNLAPNFNIVISTDHGFITNAGKTGLTEFLISNGLKRDRESDDVVMAGGALYVKGHDEAVIQRIVSALQGQEWVGAIFTKSKNAGDLKGHVAGTLSFESIHWNHPVRSADILVDENWDDRKNKMGYPGTSYSGGVAGHGGLSPYEVKIALIAGGPSFKRGYESDWPTCNVDLVPTVLKIHGIAVPSGMDGRIMHELLAGTETPKNLKPKKETIKTSARNGSREYQLTLERTVLGNHTYVDFAKVSRPGL